MIGYAHDVDFFDLWSNLVLEEFHRSDRVYTCGTAYLRGMGRGRVHCAVHGIDQLQRELGELVVPSPTPTARPGGNVHEGRGCHRCATERHGSYRPR